MIFILANYFYFRLMLITFDFTHLKTCLMTASTIIPILRYDRTKEAVEWLCKAFGFEKRVIFEDASGEVIHGELSYGNGMIMIGTTGNVTEFGKHMRQPRETGGGQTMCAYLIVEDPDAHHARAVAEGARVILDLKTEDYGGKSYSCLDPEGFLWSFGSYNPWEQQA